MMMETIMLFGIPIILALVLSAVLGIENFFVQFLITGLMCGLWVLVLIKIENRPKDKTMAVIDKRIEQIKALINKGVNMQKDAWKLNQIESQISSEFNLIDLMKSCMDEGMFNLTLSSIYSTYTNRLQNLLQNVEFFDSNIPATVTTTEKLRLKKTELTNEREKAFEEAVALSQGFIQIRDSNKDFASDKAYLNKMTDKINALTCEITSKMAEINKFNI